MSKWRKTVKLRDLITGDTSPDAIKALANGIIERLPLAPHRSAREALDLVDSDPEGALDAVNDALDFVYDWADENRVWIA
jgi:hypothetical protein